MIFKRDLSLIAYPVKTPFVINYESGLRIQETNLRQPLIVPSIETAFGALVGGASVSVQLPKGYTDAKNLFFLLRTNGDLEISVTSPEHAASKNYIFGTATCPGLFVRQSRVTSISIANPTIALTGVTYSWVAVSLPDLSLNSSYQGMSSDGTAYLS